MCDRRYYGSHTVRKRGLGGRIHSWPRRSYPCPTQYPYPTQASDLVVSLLFRGLLLLLIAYTLWQALQ
jgi:hypothetical protein